MAKGEVAPAIGRNPGLGRGEREARTAKARLFRLEEGLYALAVAAFDARAAQPSLAEMNLPAVQISAPPSESFDPVELLAASGGEGWWLSPEGGVFVVKAPQGGGVVLVTSYGTAGAIEIAVRRLGAPPPRLAKERSAAPAPNALRLEVALHIERQGDRSFAEEGWVGNRGQGLSIEAFAIRPLERLSPGDVEYMAFGPGGRETAWVSEGKLCGSRGRGLPLTGFAIRLLPHLADRFDLHYEGAFFEGGVCGPQKDGEPCLSPFADDPLEALNIRLVEKAS